jgi:hypothetical protein
MENARSKQTFIQKENNFDDFDDNLGSILIYM